MRNEIQNEMNECHHDESWFKRHRWITWCAVAVIAAYLFTEHRAHVVAFLPYLLLASCPLMHLFMHHGHDHHHSVHESGEKKEE